ncbi:MAG: nucleoside monophosphate kinase [Isosphaeraceae bacterium]|nr:nucleoside monophosphate kinase [Isosphaeraceae bacterium]
MALSAPPQHVVVFGRPGSGKSSLSERLGDEFGYQLIRTGEMLRAAIRRQDFLGKRVEVHLAKGDLVPDPLIFELLEQNLRSPGTEKLIFDGFPRTMGQVELLEQFEKKLHFQIECYLEIAVSREEATARMTGRRICPVCGATYHLKSLPPRIAGRCDLDGAALETRKDDDPEVVATRQQIYDQHATPILEYYSTHFPNQYIRIHGEQPFEMVYAETCRALRLIAQNG